MQVPGHAHTHTESLCLVARIQFQTLELSWRSGVMDGLLFLITGIPPQMNRVRSMDPIIPDYQFSHKVQGLNFSRPRL